MFLYEFFSSPKSALGLLTLFIIVSFSISLTFAFIFIIILSFFLRIFIFVIIFKISGCSGSSLLLTVLYLVTASRNYCLVSVCGLLTAMASLVAQPRLQNMGLVVAKHGLGCPGGMRNLPRRGIEPMPTALAGGCLSTGPPGKSSLESLC